MIRIANSFVIVIAAVMVTFAQDIET